MKVGIILQARMGSKRLPGKTTLPILGRPMIHYVIERLKRVRTAQNIVLAVPDTAPDQVLEGVALAEGIDFFAGAEDDVLDRYRAAGRRLALDHIVRATGDNPLVDPVEVERLIRFHVEGQFEYAENFTVLPRGVGGEVFSAEGLERCWRLSDQPHQREGVNDYILEHPEVFRRATLEYNPYPGIPRELDCTVDTQEQFGCMATLYERLYREGDIIPTPQALSVLEEMNRR